MSSDCYCSVAIPHGVMGWSAVCVLWNFLILGLNARLSTVHAALRDVNVNV